MIRILYLSERKIYSYGLISFILCFLILSVYYLPSIYSPYHIILSTSYFWSFSITLTAILDGSLISYNLWREYRKSKRIFKSTIVNKNAIKSIEWVKDRDLSDKLILSFMALLVMCALLLILAIEPVAEQFANVAYFALVAGVVIKFVKFFKEESVKSEENSEQD